MEAFPSFQSFLETSSSEISTIGFLVNIILSSLLAWMVGYFYVSYGNSLSNRQSFSKNFVPLSLITTLIISVVKSSLALSLGLVGALSIVRFRVAIKEPEELIYLFLCISIGLGFGADQGIITILTVILFFVIIKTLEIFSKEKIEKNNLHLSVSLESPSSNFLEDVIHYLNENCEEIELKRSESSNDYFEASFFVKFSSTSSFTQANKELKKLSKDVKISFFDIDSAT